MYKYIILILPIFFLNVIYAKDKKIIYDTIKPISSDSGIKLLSKSKSFEIKIQHNLPYKLDSTRNNIFAGEKYKSPYLGYYEPMENKYYYKDSLFSSELVGYVLKNEFGMPYLIVFYKNGAKEPKINKKIKQNYYKPKVINYSSNFTELQFVSLGFTAQIYGHLPLEEIIKIFTNEIGSVEFTREYAYYRLNVCKTYKFCKLNKIKSISSIVAYGLNRNEKVSNCNYNYNNSDEFRFFGVRKDMDYYKKLNNKTSF